MCISRGTGTIVSTIPILDNFERDDHTTGHKLNCVLINTVSGFQILNIHLPVKCQDVSMKCITDSDQLVKDGGEVIFCGDFNYSVGRSKCLIESLEFSLGKEEQFLSEQRGGVDHCFSARFRRSP
jgi:hypothetical protein